MNTNRLDYDTIRKVKRYSSNTEPPRLPIESKAVLILYKKAIAACLTKADTRGMSLAKRILFYCLN